MRIESALNEEELLARMKDDDHSALDIIYRAYWRSMYASSFRILQDHDQCSDIIQDIFVNLWQIRRQLNVNVSLRAYLHAAVRYEVFRQIRYRRVHEDIFTFVDSLESHSEGDGLEYKELHEKIHRVVEALPERCREVFKMSRMEQLSHREIAERLSISTKTVEYHIANALKFLRGHIGDLLSIELFLLFTTFY